MTAAPGAGDLAARIPLIAFRDRIRKTLEPLAHGHSECALVGFPDSSNVGDSAIWLGELAWLSESGIRVAYRCHERSYDADILRQSSPRGLILLHGGGNLGDVWPRPQRLREQVIQDFPDRTIVQLPQTMYFRGREPLARARSVFDGHPSLTLLVRDTASLDVARREFRAPSLLCPDMALYLGSLERRRAPDVDVLWLQRTDVEAVPYVAAGGSAAIVTDWLDRRPPLLRRARNAFQPILHRYPRRLRALRRLSEQTLDWQAAQRMRFGCRLLARGRVVVTDRLHGHILCVLLGIPHVILDNAYGKLRHFYDTWTRALPFVRWADSPADASAAVEQLRPCSW